MFKRVVMLLLYGCLLCVTCTTEYIAGGTETTSNPPPIVIETNGSWFLTADGTLFEYNFDCKQTPIEMKGNALLSDVKTISDGYGAFAIKKDNTLWAKGDNGNCQLCDSTRTSRSVFGKVIGDVQGVSQATSYNLILKTDNSLWGCGYMFNPPNSDSTVPVHIMDDVKGVSSSFTDYSLILKTDGTLLEYHPAYASQRKNDIFIEIMEDVQIMEAEQYQTLILKSDGTLFMQKWDLKDSKFLEPLEVMKGVKMISSSMMGSNLIIKTEGILWAFGANGCGQLGDGTTTDAPSPIQIMSDVNMYMPA